MGPCMSHGGGVAAAHLPACHAQPQMNPWRAEPKTVLTTVRRAWPHRPHNREMRVGCDSSADGAQDFCSSSCSVIQDRST